MVLQTLQSAHRWPVQPQYRSGENRSSCHYEAPVKIQGWVRSYCYHRWVITLCWTENVSSNFTSSNICIIRVQFTECKVTLKLLNVQTCECLDQFLLAKPFGSNQRESDKCFGQYTAMSIDDIYDLKPTQATVLSMRCYTKQNFLSRSIFYIFLKWSVLFIMSRRVCKWS